MDKIQIINEQFQRPETLSRIAKNQNMAREEQKSRADQLLENGMAVQGKALGEKFKEYMEGKDIHNDAEKTLQKSLTAGELLGRATDEKMQKRTKYKDGMYNESLDELQLLNQTEDIAATDFYNQTMSEVGTYAEQPKEVFEGKLLEYFNGLKAKYKDKPAYANALITKYSGMAQDLMSNYTKQRQAVMQKQANAASQKMKLQSADAFTGGMMAAGIDEEERQRVQEGYMASFSLESRGKESVEAFTTGHYNAQMHLLDNGNIQPFKLYKQTELYSMLTDTQRDKMETAEKKYNGKIISGLKEKLSNAKFAALNGDMSEYKRILIEDIPAAEARLSGHIEGYEDLASIKSQIATGYERQEDLRQKEMDRGIQRQRMALEREDRDLKSMMSNVELNMSNFEKRMEVAKTDEERANIAFEQEKYIAEHMEIANGINNPIARHMVKDRLNGTLIGSKLDMGIKDQKEREAYNKDVVTSKSDEIVNTINTIASYTPVQMSAMTKEELEKDDAILMNSYKTLQDMIANKNIPEEEKPKLREKLQKTKETIIKRDRESQLYGRMKEGVDNSDLEEYDRQNPLEFTKKGIKSSKIIGDKYLSSEANRKGAVRDLKKIADRAGWAYKTNNDIIENIIKLEPQTLDAIIERGGMRSLIKEYTDTMEVNIHSEEAPTREEADKAQKLLEKNEQVEFLDGKVETKLEDIVKAYRVGRPVKSMRVNNALPEVSKLVKEEVDIINRDTELSKLDVQGQQNFTTFYRENLRVLPQEEALKRAKQRTLRNRTIKGVVNIENKIPIDQFDPEKTFTVKVKGVGGGEQSVSVNDILTTAAETGLFNNVQGLKDKSYTKNLGSPFVTLQEIRDLYRFETVLRDEKPNIVMTNITEAGNTIIINYEQMKAFGLLHSAKTRNYLDVYNKSVSGNSIAGFNKETIDMIRNERTQEIAKQLEIK